jgi:hypothetical protein
LKEEPSKLWVAQLQVKNKEDFGPAEQRRVLKNMDDVAQRVRPSAGQRSPAVSVPGIDILLRFGEDPSQGSKCNFSKKANSNRACLLLSTDSKLSLFHKAFSVVTESETDADRLSSAFQRLVDAERSAFFKSKTWSPCKEARSKAHELETQMESLTDVFIVEDKTK